MHKIWGVVGLMLVLSACSGEEARPLADAPARPGDAVVWVWDSYSGEMLYEASEGDYETEYHEDTGNVSMRTDVFSMALKPASDFWPSQNDDVFTWECANRSTDNRDVKITVDPRLFERDTSSRSLQHVCAYGDFKLTVSRVSDTTGIVTVEIFQEDQEYSLKARYPGVPFQ